MRMKKKVLVHICIFAFVLCIAFIVNGNTARAASGLEIRVKSSESVRLTEHKPLRISVYYNGKDVTEEAWISCISSNESVLDVEDGNLEEVDLCAKKIGKSIVTITAEYRFEPYWDDEKNEVINPPALQAKAKCTVKVQYYKSLRAHACLIDYNTRNNTFVIKVQNLSNKKLTILSKGAKARDCDYKSYDRKLRIKGKSKIVIKPGQTKKISFKVIGKLTWYDIEDFEIRSYWKWGKKKYLVSVDSFEDTRAKSGKKWKYIGFANDSERWYDE